MKIGNQPPETDSLKELHENRMEGWMNSAAGRTGQTGRYEYFYIFVSFVFSPFHYELS
jgi:hypothetical protein